MRFVAGRGRRGEETGSAVADSHREDAARMEMVVAKRHREDANQHREATASGSAVAERNREDADDRELRQKAASGSHTAAKGRWQGSSSGV